MLNQLFRLPSPHSFQLAVLLVLSWVLAVPGLVAAGSPDAGDVDQVTLAVDGKPCYALFHLHTGSGADPLATPGASSGCSAGRYYEGETISLTAAPTGGWYVAGWSGTSDDGNTSTTNSLTMPAANTAVSVAYAFDGPLTNGVQISDSMPASPSQTSWRYYYFDIPAGATQLSVALYYLGGDSDLYLLPNARPTLDTFGCRPFSGLGPEECRVFSPSPGRWWIGVNNFDASPIAISYVIWAAWTMSDNWIFTDGFEYGSNSQWSSSAGLQTSSPP
jgi:hypothetical protein